jgi:outer membrane protein OmpA-like peptidoglycan-associated protein
MFVGRYACKSRSAAVYLSAMVVLFLVATSAFAQTDSNPGWDLFIGYQWLHPGATIPLPFDNPAAPSAYTVPDLPGGFGLAGAYNFDPHFAAEVDFGDNQTTNNSETTFSIGPRFMWRTEYAHYFIHALLSDNRLSVNGTGNNGIGAILGGGMDLPITKNIAFRLFEADYVWARHNYADDAAPEFPNLRRASLEGTRLRTGIVLSWGGTEPLVPAASCTVQPSEVMVGEPITANVTASNFNPKHTVVFVWSGNGVTGKDTTASIDTTNAAPGSYTVTVKVTDPKERKNNEASCSANFTVKPLPPKNPPTMSISANPTELVTGGSVNLSAMCTSPDGVPVSVANWTSTSGSVSGSGTSASLNTAGLQPGPVTITATCTDSRGLTAQATTQVTIDAPPPPPVDKALEARLALHSVYFPTNIPPPNNPNANMVASQQRTLQVLATDFKKYLEAKPDAHLILEGHADIRGTDAYNQALSERRVNRVKAYLVEQGVPESDIEVKAFGKERNLTLEEVKASVEKNTELTTEERRRALARINVIKLASNRRVDVTLKSGAQTENSVREFPFNAADAMTLIGGRTPVGAAAPAPRKRVVPKKKPQ